MSDVGLHFENGSLPCFFTNANQFYSLIWDVRLPVLPVRYDNLLSFKDNWRNRRPVISMGLITYVNLAHFLHVSTALSSRKMSFLCLYAKRIKIFSKGLYFVFIPLFTIELIG